MKDIIITRIIEDLADVLMLNFKQREGLHTAVLNCMVKGKVSIIELRQLTMFGLPITSARAEILKTGKDISAYISYPELCAILAIMLISWKGGIKI